MLRRLADRRRDLLRRPDGNRRLVHHDGIAREVPSDLPGRAQDVLQVCAAVLTGRRAHGDEHDFGACDALGVVRGEAQPAVADVALQELLEARLVDGHDPAFQPVDLGLIDVDADDGVPALGEASSGNQADVARTDDGNAHEVVSREESWGLESRRCGVRQNRVSPLRLGRGRIAGGRGCCSGRLTQR